VSRTYPLTDRSRRVAAGPTCWRLAAICATLRMTGRWRRTIALRRIRDRFDEFDGIFD
jgi:hypothetical protein